MRDVRLRDHGVTQLTCRNIMVIIVVTATIVTIDAADRANAVDRVLGSRQCRYVKRVRMVQTLRQIIDAQLRMVQRMPMRRRGRCRLMHVRHRWSRHGIVHVDSAIVTAMPIATASCSGVSGIVMMMMMMLLLRLLLLRL